MLKRGAICLTMQHCERNPSQFIRSYVCRTAPLLLTLASQKSSHFHIGCIERALNEHHHRPTHAGRTHSHHGAYRVSRVAGNQLR